MHTIEALIRQNIAQLNQEKVADLCKMPASSISRILSGTQGIPLEKLGDFIKAVGLDITAPDSDEVLISRDRLHALKLLARDGLEGGE